MKKYHMTEEEYKAVGVMAKKNKNKSIDKRLQVIILRHEGMKDVEIAKRTGYHRKRVSQLCAEFSRVGAMEYARNKYGGNHRSLTDEEEAEILTKFEKQEENGQMVSVKDIKAAFDEKLGRDTGRGYIYMLLKRRNWRKVTPRPRHPKKASAEAIAASKKLKNFTRK